MPLLLERWDFQQTQIPRQGQHILAQQPGELIIVYQAYKPSIAQWSVQHQQLGGADFSYRRMSWIKPNFLWMMFRCGWASKENQERVLAFWLAKKDFETILEAAVHTSFDASSYATHADWKAELDRKPVRLQWDPDHDPFGKPCARRAVQLGLKDELLEQFGKQFVQRIEDVTELVHAQKSALDAGGTSALQVPAERVFAPASAALCKRINLDH